MKPLLTLKPDWQLLEKYGYVNKPDLWSLDGQVDVSKDCVEYYILNNIPGSAPDIIENIKTVLDACPIKSVRDTLMFICIDQADWFHAKLYGSYQVYHTNKSHQELASFLYTLGIKSKADIELQVKLGKDVLVRVTHPWALQLIEDILLRRIESRDFITTQGDPTTSFTKKNLSRIATKSISKPYRLKNKLRAIFIAKLHEFISKETDLKHSQYFFTTKQKSLIYELGLCLGIFPEGHKGKDAKYVEHLYRDNIKLFERIAKGGRVDIF